MFCFIVVFVLSLVFVNDNNLGYNGIQNLFKLILCHKHMEVILNHYNVPLIHCSVLIKDLKH